MTCPLWLGLGLSFTHIVCRAWKWVFHVIKWVCLVVYEIAHRPFSTVWLKKKKCRAANWVVAILAIFLLLLGIHQKKKQTNISSRCLIHWKDSFRFVYWFIDNAVEHLMVQHSTFRKATVDTLWKDLWTDHTVVLPWQILSFSPTHISLIYLRVNQCYWMTSNNCY